MKNHTKTSKRTANKHSVSSTDYTVQEAKDFAEIERLFAMAGAEQDSLQDDNFTKMVVNSLPSSPKRVNKLSLSLDLFGLTIGGLLALFLIDFKSVFAGLLNQGVNGSNEVTGQLLASASQASSLATSSDTLVISVGAVMIAVTATTIASLAAWYLVERSSSPIL